MKHLGLKIKHLRAEKGVSAKKLAQDIGRQGKNIEQFIYDIESGKTKSVSAVVLKQIADALGVEIMEFYSFLNKEKQDELSLISEPNPPGYTNQSIEQKYIRALEEITKLQRKIIDLQEGSKD